MKTNVGTWVNWCILLCSIGLLEWHGILFWQANVGVLGWAWSLLLEAAALWLWYRPRFMFRSLAMVASCLTLLGPVYQVAAPSFNSLYSTQAGIKQNATQLASLTVERDSLQSLIKTYQHNSLKRTGWLPPIQQAQSQLQAVNKKIVGLSGATPKTHSWMNQWTIIMEVVSLILFQLVAVLCITSLSSTARRKVAMENAVENGKTPMENSLENAGKHQRKQTENTPETIDNTAFPSFHSDGNKENGVVSDSVVSMEKWMPDFPLETDNVETMETPLLAAAETTQGLSVFDESDPVSVLVALDNSLRETGETATSFGRKHGISARDMSFLRNHKKLVEEGKRTISKRGLERVISALQCNA